MQRRIEIDNSYLNLLDINRQLWRAVDLPTLKRALDETMPKTGILTAFLSRFCDGSNSELFALRD